MIAIRRIYAMKGKVRQKVLSYVAKRLPYIRHVVAEDFAVVIEALRNRCLPI